MNWRKPIIHAALRATRSDVPDNLQTIRRLWNADRETVRSHRGRKMTRLLRHARETVPYYADVLEARGVVDDDGVSLERFSELPLLTKETLREEGDRLLSTDPGPDPYTNTSGGTTGEPVEFVQDQYYWEWNVATKLFYQELAGKPLGGREVKLWGSERDLRDGSIDLKSRAVEFLYNRRVCNSYRMGESDMREHVETIDSFRPLTIWAYVESIHQLARYVERNELDVHSPNGVVTTAGTLHEPVRETIEDAFDTTVFNQYGSREVGDIACECRARDGLHVFPHAAYVEIVDEYGRPLPPGEPGRIAVTSLTNRSMPLIRYEIGDVGVRSPEPCRCGRPFPTLARVTGRVTDHFLTTDGDLVHPGYLRKTLYHRDWIEKFRIRQTATDRVEYAIERRDGRSPPDADLAEIERATHTVLGDDVRVTFSYPERIDESESGKFRYTISEVV
ncbi:phenylacetate--CoA ligase family protein [Halovivax gelatinilyticus]|uniref:phenylacetate--CoA ligase family protein n=1 Tax=Halovivax gelatinilyticus TaxID=2961597 RepID=UPI0020CA3B42|nr:phenylacetate--CoA ligase family protein [Halovivax gelatinilyticus]